MAASPQPRCSMNASRSARQAPLGHLEAQGASDWAPQRSVCQQMRASAVCAASRCAAVGGRRKSRSAARPVRFRSSKRRMRPCPCEQSRPRAPLQEDRGRSARGSRGLARPARAAPRGSRPLLVFALSHLRCHLSPHAVTHSHRITRLTHTRALNIHRREDYAPPELIIHTREDAR